MTTRAQRVLRKPARADRFPTPHDLALAAVLVLGTPLVAVAQTAPAAPAAVEQIVITASGFEQKLTDAPASISVISEQDLQRKRYGNLAQALADVEGVDISQGTGKTGGLNISIRGMPSAYTLILIDGRRQNNGGDITPNGFGETSTSFMPPMSAIARIEVIRGPMSTLYGSDAMGGVVNIITKKVPDAWGGSVSLNHTLHEDDGYGASTGANLYLAGPLAAGLGLAVRGSWYDRGASELRFGDGSVVSRRGAAAVEGRNSSLGARLTFAPHEDHSFWLDVEGGRQVYENGNCQLGTLDGFGGNATAGCTTPNTTAAGYADRLRFNRDQAVLAYQGNLGFGFVDASYTHKRSETLGRTVPGTIGTAWTGFPGIVGGAPRLLESEDRILDAKLVTELGAHTLTVGGQWLEAEVADGLATERFEQRSLAVFAEDEWRLSKSLALTLGARYEDHETFGGHVSPRGYLVWSASDEWTLKGGVGRGFRAPTVNQLHDGINGATAQGRTITIGSPHLKPEKSTNTEIGVYFNKRSAGFNANLTVFQTQFKDMISSGTAVPNCWSATSPNQPGCLDFGSGFTQDSFAQSTNIDEAETRGVEVALRWAFARAWSVAANYTFTDTEQKSGVDAGAPVTNQAQHIVNAGLNWDTTDKLSLWLRGEYQSGRDRYTSLYANLSAADRAVVDGLGKLKAFHQFHLGGAYRFSERLTLTATVYNLFDKDFLQGRHYTTNIGATAWGSYYTQIGAATTGTLQEGRRLWLSVNASF